MAVFLVTGVQKCLNVWFANGVSLYVEEYVIYSVHIYYGCLLRTALKYHISCCCEWEEESLSTWGLCRISNLVHSVPEISGHTWKLFKNSGSVLIFTSLMIQPVSVMLYCSKWKLRIHLYLRSSGYYLSASFHWKLHCFGTFEKGCFEVGKVVFRDGYSCGSLIP